MSIGIENVVNTSCPTVWSLNKSHCKNISTKKNQKVVCTLTDYHQNPKSDTLFLLMMLKKYEHCYLWLQGAGDREYFDSLNLPAGSFELVPPKLSAYDHLLSNKEVDYIGTRLHAGIRAMQRGQRTLVLGIDNRALEIGKNIGLNVCDRTDTEAISRFCCGGEESLLKIPQQEIELWKRQFIQ
jgi:polysaccharide pyruvyl transferase WcaK-like protein